MASNYAIRVESDARDAASYKLRVSRDGRTWNAVKDRAQLDAFHARATRLGATNGVAFSTKPVELEAYLSDVARHASSGAKEELVSSFLEADDDERGAERAFLEELAAVVRGRVSRIISPAVVDDPTHTLLASRRWLPPLRLSTRRSKRESVAAMASPQSHHTPPSPRPLITQLTNAGPRRRRAIQISRPLRFVRIDPRRVDGRRRRAPARARPSRAGSARRPLAKDGGHPQGGSKDLRRAPER